MVSFGGAPITLGLRKFSYVTSSIEQTKHVWNHFSQDGLLAIFHDSMVEYGSRPRRRLTVQCGNEILEDLCLEDLLIQPESFAQRPCSQQSNGPESLLIIIKTPLLAIRYRLDAVRMRRIQLSFVDGPSFAAAHVEIRRVGLPFRDKDAQDDPPPTQQSQSMPPPSSQATCSQPLYSHSYGAAPILNNPQRWSVAAPSFVECFALQNSHNRALVQDPLQVQNASAPDRNPGNPYNIPGEVCTRPPQYPADPLESPEHLRRTLFESSPASRPVTAPAPFEQSAKPIPPKRELPFANSEPRPSTSATLRASRPSKGKSKKDAEKNTGQTEKESCKQDTVKKETVKKETAKKETAKKQTTKKGSTKKESVKKTDPASVTSDLPSAQPISPGALALLSESDLNVQSKSDFKSAKPFPLSQTAASTRSLRSCTFSSSVANPMLAPKNQETKALTEKHSKVSQAKSDAAAESAPRMQKTASDKKQVKKYSIVKTISALVQEPATLETSAPRVIEAKTRTMPEPDAPESETSSRKLRSGTVTRFTQPLPRAKANSKAKAQKQKEPLRANQEAVNNDKACQAAQDTAKQDTATTKPTRSPLKHQSHFYVSSASQTAPVSPLPHSAAQHLHEPGFAETQLILNSHSQAMQTAQSSHQDIQHHIMPAAQDHQDVDMLTIGDSDDLDTAPVARHYEPWVSPSVPRTNKYPPLTAIHPSQSNAPPTSTNAHQTAHTTDIHPQAIDADFRAYVDTFVRTYASPSSTAHPNPLHPPNPQRTLTPPPTEQQQRQRLQSQTQLTERGNSAEGTISTEQSIAPDADRNTSGYRAMSIEEARASALDAEIRRYLADPDFEVLCDEVARSCRRLGMGA